jgi:hypothetical protein
MVSGSGRLEGGPKRARCVVESRSCGALRDAERLGHRHEGQARVVMEDEDSPLVERKPAEGLLQLVAVGDRLKVVASLARSIGRMRTVDAHSRLRGASA